MTRTPELRSGDVVLVRGHVATTIEGVNKIFFNTETWDYPEHLDIVCIEPRAFVVGDRVIAHGRHHATVMAVWPDGDLLWLQVDEGSGRDKGRGWTVNIADCRREPPPPPSAEIVPFKEAAE